MKEKIVVENDYQKIIEIEKLFYILDKKDKICVLPYTISTNGLLDKIGVVQDWNYIEEESVLTLLNDYVYDDDKTDLVASNRILFEILGNNIAQADSWMFLGNLYNNMSSDSPIKIYAVNISDIPVKTDEDVEEQERRKSFKLLDSATVIQSDDMLFLGAYLRLFNYFYVNSLNQDKNS